VRYEGNSATTEIRSTPTGDRVFEKEDFGVTRDYYPEEEALARIASTDWVHIGMLPRAAELVDRLTRLSPAIQISQDCSVSSGYGALAVAFASAGEDHDAAVELALAAVRNGARLAVITKGASGSTAFDGIQWWEQDAVSTRVVDTTGAGDSFVAGFIHATLNGEPVPIALITGSRWAAATCEHRAGFPQ
jgi:fructoselysine 6-kinase